jgi:hypothetical protein
MSLVKTLSTLVALATLTATAFAADYNRFGKGPTTAGLTPSGYGVSGGYVRQYVQPAPVVATAPVADGRRMFSAEPAAPAVAIAPANNGRRTFSVEPSTVPAVGATPRAMSSAPKYDRFGKGASTIGLTPSGFGR